ncbi:MAG: flagellin [Sulfurospirillum sp.]
MRITDSLFHLDAKNSYQDSLRKLYDINTQISSGSKIQNSYENSSIYVDTMRLNNEISTFDQAKKSSSKAQTFANNTDATMNELDDTLTKFKSKLIQAANGTNSTTSLGAIADDLSAMRDHLISIANTSINGQFLFSGSALDIKPVNNDGSYSGNGEKLTSLVGSGVRIPYNVDGESLFLGHDSDYEKIVSTNVAMLNKTVEKNSGDKVYLKSSDTLQDMVGGDATTNGKTVFYLSGRKPDGETFNKKFSLDGASKVSDLLDSIGTSYGNTASSKVVDVSLNNYGQIEVKDKTKGNSLLQMNVFGAIDRTASGSVGNADQTDIDALGSAANVDIVAFDKSNFINANGVTLNDSANYTRKNFKKNGNDILGNVSQFVKSSGEYATASTKLVDVSGASSLDSKKFILSGADISGNPFRVEINFSNGAGGTTFSTDGGVTNYSVFDANGNPTNADNMTYQQLNDVVSMATTSSVPVANDQVSYNNAVDTAKNSVDVTMDYRGRINIHDKTNSVSKINFAIYDNDADQFDGTKNPAMSFMANDAVTIQEPHIDFFKEIDQMINAVRGGNFNMNSDFSDPRNLGIQNSILKIDHISDHTIKMHTKIGSYSNALQSAGDRADLLSLNVKTIRSKIADVDLAEAYTQFTQLSNSYQATLSTIAKINSMTLLKYM